MSQAFGTILSSSTDYGVIETGTVLLWTGLYTSIPSGFLICDGAAVSDITYADLLAVTGTRYGAGGAGTFNVPNMLDKFPLGATSSASGGNSGGSCSFSFSCSGSTNCCGCHTHCVKNVCTCSCYLSASSFYKNGSYRAACCGRHCHCLRLSTCCCGCHSHNFSISCSCTQRPPFLTFVFIIKT